MNRFFLDNEPDRSCTKLYLKDNPPNLDNQSNFENLKLNKMIGQTVISKLLAQSKFFSFGLSLLKCCLNDTKLRGMQSSFSFK